ncbi:UDP-N-acetylmuramoyl-L-alanyl-D-glutamate--2,6-diaminopimelate ligase [Nocardia jejuensis]|uniref:UDP-N-acetylmuramoyl-L-alanyl-D-glutamate--2, 6-diaminopimelate ligase n=1 Tax=Nocardia jejuensis TaxID=328049 RepID=UPI0009FCCD5E|nr:UDP-N-acetylmuramoyl-L-alanyl-D-glutamate--2,6-diaminopimelate ligase [Nocardia jejuensis]
MPAQSQVLRPAVPPVTTLRTVAELTGATPIVGGGATPTLGAAFESVQVTGIEQRSGEIQPGDLFTGLAGSHSHGARFAHDAVARGAVAIFTDQAGADLIGEVEVPVLVHAAPRSVLGKLSSALYGDPSRKLRIIGITGTSGKTTTSYLVETGLAAAGFRTALLGTIETRIGGVHVPSALTTPEAPQLHALFAVMVEQGVNAVVMEVSSHALALGRVDGVQFEVGAFTNLSQDHLDFHKDFEDYYAAKRRLFIPDHSPAIADSVSAAGEMRSADAAPQVDDAAAGHSAAAPQPFTAAYTAVICVDDAWGRRLRGEILADSANGSRYLAPDSAPPVPHGRLITVSTSPEHRASWLAGPATARPSGIQEFTLEEFTESGLEASFDVRLRLPGNYNVANASLAIAVCQAAGADPAVVAAALAEVDVPGRMQRVDRGQDFLAVVDYAHKPAAIESVVVTLRALLAEQGHGRLAVVVGAGGDRDAGKRPLMGAAAARGADLLIITDDNPRSEDPAVIRAAVRTGAERVPADQRGEVREVGDRAAAIEAAVDWAQPGDVVLVAGKGHETGQEISGVKHPFDDREVLVAALSRKTRDLTHS